MHELIISAAKTFVSTTLLSALTVTLTYTGWVIISCYRGGKP